jgi:sigma-E factor negative regulatory protein RseB
MIRDKHSRAACARFLVLALLSCVPVAVLWAESDGEARAWLDRMTEALQTLNYDATFVYLHGRQLEAMRIIHKADETGERERLVFLNGAPREVIRNNEIVVCFLPDANSVVVEKSRARKPFPDGLLDAERLSRHYDFVMLGRDRMVGQSARVIGIVPKDPYRYGYRLWLAEESAMLLKSELMNEQGQPIEQMMVTSLELLDDIPAASLEPSSEVADAYVWREGVGERGPIDASDRRWQVGRQPEGFVLTLYRRQHLPGSSEPVEHLVLSDGLATVSVFIEKTEGSRQMLRGTSYMGAVNAFGTQIAKHQVTVVGEVPQATVVLIGESVSYVDADRQ